MIFEDESTADRVDVKMVDSGQDDTRLSHMTGPEDGHAAQA